MPTWLLQGISPFDEASKWSEKFKKKCELIVIIPIMFIFCIVSYPICHPRNDERNAHISECDVNRAQEELHVNRLHERRVRQPRRLQNHQQPHRDQAAHYGTPGRRSLDRQTIHDQREKGRHDSREDDVVSHGEFSPSDGDVVGDVAAALVVKDVQISGDLDELPSCGPVVFAQEDVVAIVVESQFDLFSVIRIDFYDARLLVVGVVSGVEGAGGLKVYNFVVRCVRDNTFQFVPSKIGTLSTPQCRLPSVQLAVPGPWM